MFSKVTGQGLLTMLGLIQFWFGQNFCCLSSLLRPGQPFCWMDSQSFLPTELSVPYCNRYGQRHDLLIKKVRSNLTKEET